MGTQALGHSGTWPFEALQALYLADSTTFSKLDKTAKARDNIV